MYKLAYLQAMWQEENKTAEENNRLKIERELRSQQIVEDGRLAAIQYRREVAERRAARRDALLGLCALACILVGCCLM